MRFSAFTITALLATVWPGGSARGQTEALVTETWHRADGLPQDSVFAIEQTADGYLWLGTSGGLARFDGARFTRFGLRDGLKSMHVVDLLDDGEGGLWIATFGGGLSHWDGGKMRSFGVEDGLAHNYTTVLAPAGPGEVWVGGAGGLQRYGPGGFEQIGEEQGLPPDEIGVLASDPKHGLWISTLHHGLFLYADGRCLQIDGPDGQASPRGHFLLVDPAGDLWVSIGDGKVLRRNGEGWTEFDHSHGLPRSFIHCLEAGAGGEIWAGSYEAGLSVFRAGKFHPVGDPQAAIRSLHRSRDGLLWAGSDGGGLSRLAPGKARFFPLPDHDQRGRIHGFVEEAPGRFLVTSYTGGLFEGSLEKLERVRGSTDIDARPFLLTALQLSSDDIYLAGIALLARKRAGSGEIETVSLDGDWTALCEGAAGELWLGGRDGRLARLVDEVPQVVAEGFSAISGLVRGENASLWIATQGAGLFHWENGKRRQWTQRDGLPIDVLRTLYRDAQGTLWIGTAGGGLVRMRDGELVAVDSRHGLGDDFISQILEDDSENLWLGTQSGIVRVSKQQLASVASGQTAQLHPLVLDESDGLTVAACSGGFSPAGLRARSGNLYFSTSRGIIEIDPRTDFEQQEPPAVRIEEVSLGGQPLVGRVLEPGARELEIRYTAFDFQKPTKLRFRSRLLGLDPDWIDVGDRRSATFPLLPPGDYVFEVSAASTAGIWSEESAALAFTIQPHFWQRAWFQFVAIFSLLALGAGVAMAVVRARVRRAELNERLAHAEVEMQKHRNEVAHLTRLATLGELSATLAHELNQPLTAIRNNAHAAQLVLASGDPDGPDLGEILEDIVSEDQRASDIISRVRAILKKDKFEPQRLPIDEVLREILRLMESDLKSRAVSVEVELAEELPAVRGDRVQLLQVLINLLQNAADAMDDVPQGHRKVSLRTAPAREAGFVEISVSDNGCGLPEAEDDIARIFEPYHTTKAEGLGLGLSLSQSIIEAHGGRIRAENNAGTGTTFSFTLPEWEH